MPPPFASMVDLMRHRALTQPDDRAFVMLSDQGNEEATLTFAELSQRADAVALALRERCKTGERALLIFPQGLDFLAALFGCFVAGVIAVPMMIPRRQSSRDASVSIIADCTPRIALTTSDVLISRTDIVERFGHLDWLAVDTIGDERPGAALPTQWDPDDIAFLQYTSGSTSEPKGAVMAHGTLLANCEMIRICHGNTAQSTYVSWLPLYHDMGLMLNVLQAFYVGAPCILMAPVNFMQRPLNWLRAISHYRAEVAGGPNFGFELCVSRFRPDQMQGVDLSSWKLALNGAEPVMAETIARFASTFAPYGFDPHAMYPAYGMAEATVLISGGRRGAGPVIKAVSRDALLKGRAVPATVGEKAQTVVGCGKVLADETIAIVEPETRKRLPPNTIGEIWVQGGNVARGYWGKPAESAMTFDARIDGEDSGPFLRTGDLGFLDEDGELVITGRIKDVIIIRGVNHHPQDVEKTVQDSHLALRRYYGAAFGITDERGEERLVIVQEVERTQRNRVSGEEIEGCIREAVVREHEVAPHRIVLILPGQIPKTTSGKIQRRMTRQLWSEGALTALEPSA